MKKIGKSTLSSKPPSARKTPKISTIDLENYTHYENKSSDVVKLLQDLNIRVRSPTLNEWLRFHKDAGYYEPLEAKELWEDAEVYDNFRYVEGGGGTLIIITNPKTGKEEAIQIYER